MFYKIVSNNMVIDLLTELRYVRYLPLSKRLVSTDSQAANGVMGSDNDTVYHLFGTVDTFPEKKTDVLVMEIQAEEYNSLSTQFAIQRKENESLHKEVAELKDIVNKQNSLLEQLLAKLG